MIYPDNSHSEEHPEILEINHTLFTLLNLSNNPDLYRNSTLFPLQTLLRLLIAKGKLSQQKEDFTIRKAVDEKSVNFACLI